MVALAVFVSEAQAADPTPRAESQEARDGAFLHPGLETKSSPSIAKSRRRL